MNTKNAGRRVWTAIACVVVVGIGPALASPATADVINEALAADVPSGQDWDLKGGVAGPVPDLKAKPYSAVTDKSDPAAPAEGTVAFPEAGTWDLSVDPNATGMAATRGEAVDLGRADSRQVAMPVSVRLDAPKEVRAEGSIARLGDGAVLRMQVLDRGQSQAVGATGFAFTLGDVRRGRRGLLDLAATAGRQVPAEITVDYSRFSGAYGADFGGRLIVRALLPCARVTPVPETCNVAGEVLPQQNMGDGKITVNIADLAAFWANGRTAAATADVSGTSGPLAGGERSAASDSFAVTFVVTSSTGSEQGTFSASDLSQASQWQVGLGTGEFSWGHSLRTPAPGVGKAPEVSLGYSTAVVDGMTNATSTQGSTVGVGWGNSAEAYVERVYESCADDKNPNPTKDLCWPTFDRPVLSLGGVSGRLVKSDSGQWSLEANPDWKIEQLWGADNRSWNGEHWKVTASDGTQYWFGLYKFPEAGSGSVTLSVPVVPIWHPFNGQPCNDNDGSYDVIVDRCTMAWRWGLDRVIDPDGNVTVYRYDLPHNRYLMVNGFFKGAAGAAVGYNRALRLKQIEYGGRVGASQPTARVVFDYERRCRSLDATCANKPQHDPKYAAEYVDVPVDLVCPDHTGKDPRCVTSPSFFEEARLANVTTAVYHAGSWRPIDHTNVNHVFQLWDSNKQGQLSVKSIQRNGVAYGGWVVHEPAEFGYQPLQNRVDTSEEKSMIRWRLNLIRNEFDGETRITYDRTNPCPAGFSTNRWDQNTGDCFPQHINDHGFTRTGAFNKYVVTQVQEDPKVAGWGGPIMTTNYVYGERVSANPTQQELHAKQGAWRFNEGSFGQDTHDFGWTNWRGYATVEIHKGGACPNPGDCEAPITRTKMRLFRGMNGDRDIEFNPRTFTVSPMSGPNQASGAVADSPILAGRALEEQRIGTVAGQADQVAEAKLHSYEIRELEPPQTGRPNGIRWAAASSTLESVATGPAQWRQRRTATSYNDDRLAVAVAESGWLDVTGDERCTATGYASNPAQHIFGLPATSALYAGDCGQGRPLTYSQVFYDGQPLGQIGQHARVTKTRVQVDQAGTFAETNTQYDQYGRATTVTDPQGRTTTTSRAANPVHGIPYQTGVANALGHTVTINWTVEHSTPLWVEDANGNRTTYKYDAEGRLSQVWTADQDPASDWPAHVFGYDVRPAYRAIHSMQLGRLNADGGPVYESTWNVYDGFWRLQETQYLSPQSGQIIIKRTSYDTVGRVKGGPMPTAIEGEPGKMIIGWSAANYTRYMYDDLGRQVRAEWLRAGEVAHATVTEYGPNTVTATGPDGNKVRTTTDGLGRDVEVAEWDGESWVSSTYTYDLAGNLLTATDPAGNTVASNYNMAGWLASRDDPNRGHAEFTYNLAGQQTSATDALGKKVFSVFDQVGRTVETRLGASDGQLVGKWEYDTAPGGIGALAKETSYTPLGQWQSLVTGYDELGRPTGTSISVPAGVPGVAGIYHIPGANYDAKGRVISSTIPAVGGLPQETVTQTYNNLGLHTSSVGLLPYTRAVGFDSVGRIASTQHGGSAADNYTAVERVHTYDNDQRLADVEVKHGPSGGRATVYRSSLKFSSGGTLIAKELSQTGQGWRECYRHDVRNRLTEAFSMDPGSDCDTADLATGEFGRGPQPFEERYFYTPDGRMEHRTTALKPDWPDIQHYTYPEQGGTAAQPHAPISTGGIFDEVKTTWVWDAAGNLVSRTDPQGATESFGWDGLNRLASHTGPAGETRFTYSASGERLTRTDPDGTITVYLLGHELKVTSGSQVLQATRTYDFDGKPVAIRTLAGTEFAVTDDAGSLVMTVNPGSGTRASRSFNPYGDTRQRAGDFGTDRGFLGKPEDSSTGLSYLGARYYDTKMAVFTQADPIWSASNVKSLNPYTYGFGNPTTFSDPSGLYSAHSFGLEVANWQLRYQNKQLMGIIGQLEADISHLQGIIKDQAKQIRELIAYARQLESYITKLENHVRYLEGVVARQARYIAELEATVAWQERRIRSLEDQVVYYKGVVDTLASRLWLGTGKLGWVLQSIHSFRGIPRDAFMYDRISALTVQLRDSERARRGLEEGIVLLEGGIRSFESGQAAQREYIQSLEEDVATLAEYVNSEAGLWGPIWDGEKLTMDRPGGGGRFSGLGDALMLIATTGAACFTGAKMVTTSGAAVAHPVAVPLAGCAAGIVVAETVKNNA